MRRTIALLGLLALSWSQVVALHCDMGSGPSEPHADAVAALAHHGMAGGGSSAHHERRHDHDRRHDETSGCPMIMACGFVSIRPVQSATMIRFPAIFVRTGFSPLVIPVAAELAVETPPPRLAA